MAYVVLVAWLIQAIVGLILLVGWIRRGLGRSAATVSSHVVLSLGGLAFWVAFVVTGGVLYAWLALAVVTVGNGIGDVMLVRRHRRMVGRATFWRDYGAAIGATFRGRMPLRVAFHALFAGVVYFSTLGVAIGATVA